MGCLPIEKETTMVDTTKIREHMEVVGSDGEHVGTVDKIEGDKITSLEVIP